VVESNFAWDTWTVPVLGGEPRRMLPNASGLTWIDPQHLLFSEIKTGIHMAIVTATDSRTEARDVYLPPHERGMAHRSYLSPDKQQVLLAEMDNRGWLPCRQVPFEGSSSGRQVGPLNGPCTSAAWSPDGRWMYLNSNAEGAWHIWRQGFPDGPPEQITFGPTEQQGIALAPDGHSLVTSAGTRQSAVWVHDAAGDHQLSSQGFAARPSFSPDGSKVYYVEVTRSLGEFVAGELHVAAKGQGTSERVLPGFSVTGYALSSDGKRLVVAAPDASGVSYLWIASADGRFSPRRLPFAKADQPFFGPGGEIYFRAPEGKSNFIYRLSQEGAPPEKVGLFPIVDLEAISPDGKWLAAWAPAGDEESNMRVVAFPSGGGSPVRLCDSLCGVTWSKDGKWLYLWSILAMMSKTFAIPLPPGQALPPLPSSGFKLDAGLSKFPGVKVIDAVGISPGPEASTYAFTQTAVHRNLYRIPLF